MEVKLFVLLPLLLLVIFFPNTPFSHGVEIISANKYITQGRTISSPNGRFEFGFFKPGESPNYYAGIWYKNISPQTTIWVANRATPIPPSTINSTKLTILHGNLVLLDAAAQNSVWSTNITAPLKLTSVLAALRDDGNLILSHDGINSTAPLWQSFDHPTNTFVPGSKVGYNKRTKTKQVFTSWKNRDDPAPGLFSFFYVPNESHQVWNGTEIYWNSATIVGNGNSSLTLKAYRQRLDPAFNFTIVDNENETYFLFYNLVPSVITRHILDVNGQQKTLFWSEAAKEWMQTFVSPLKQCDVYAYCGEFGICSDNSTPVCDCLHGFRRKSETEWGLNEFFLGGCVRNTNLKCGFNYQEEDIDLFRRYPNVRLPRHPQNTTTKNQADCKSICLKNCSCTAYAYSSGCCSFWVGQLLNLKQLGEEDGNGSTIYIRFASPSEFSNQKGTNSKFKAIIPSVAVGAAALLGCSICYICYRRRRTKHAIMDQSIDEDTDEEKVIGVQFFSLQSILEATDNFSEANKLGKGGFGIVYKGVFFGGQEIAVKRLSSESGQGINEFKNEVALIAKLQHRNLVKLVGYCTQAKEKILLYEYMPNKSLDTFIFEQTHRLLLDWSKRFDVILGIARGLVYIHHDSRLRIVHRDIKTNNILLDEEMTPKISDFGLARMMVGNTFEANTKKIAGTYGYMSPEYALSGLFSIKSDVFSFGVIILEIICGKKNKTFYWHEEVSNLLGYAWKLWNEGNAMDLLDDSLLECCKECEVLKCINVGLLCVEEDPNCRPNMSNVLRMLTDESMALPKPNQPAFVTRTQTCNDSSIIRSEQPCSNHMTFSTQEGR